MTAFVRGKHFQDVSLFERLESHFVERIDEARGPTIVSMFTAHASWANHMIDECVV
jgi:hypothetical protein